MDDRLMETDASASSDAGDLLGIRGRRAVITGGSRGVGRAAALLLGRLGAHVGIGFRSRAEEAREVVAALTGMGVSAWAEQGDLSSEEGVQALFRRAEDEFDGLDFFVGNHGIWPPDDVPLERMTTEQWRRTMEVNLDSLFWACREAIPRMGAGGRIVLVTSTAAQRGEAFHGDYAASKGALVSLVKGLSTELGPRDITVNSVAPGWVDTEMSASALTDETRDRIVQGIPLRRVATAEDAAGPVVFLCSVLARHVTGEVVNVNGGAVLPG
jgi:3-oxoacyl-[acyl-carrier protein] reductase